MIAEVAESITQRFNADSVFKNALSGRLYFQQAPQDATMPYGVFYINGVTQEEIMGTADDNITEVAIQFNLFTDNQDGGAGLASLAKNLTDCFDWQELNVSGWNYIKMQRENMLPVGFVDDVWQVTFDYSLGIQKE